MLGWSVAAQKVAQPKTCCSIISHEQIKFRGIIKGVVQGRLEKVGKGTCGMPSPVKYWQQ
jgi:hypothetical protein